MVINYNNSCNFKCDFCYSKGDQEKYRYTELSFDVLADFADQAHELGFFHANIMGGELLLDVEKLYELVRCIKPERFEVAFVTNGFLMTEEIAYKLAKLGVDCVGVSMSSLDAEEFDRTRRVKGGHARALKAMEYVDKAGMIVWPNAIFGHHNAGTRELEDFLEWTTKKNYSVFFNFAIPYGSWHDNQHIIIDNNDMEILNSYRKKYKVDIESWNRYDGKNEMLLGCNSVNRIYLTPKGDVFPCCFMPISLGNILKQPLKEIVDYGFSIKWFRNHYHGCLIGQCKEFREKFFKIERTIFNPLIAKEIFDKEDYVNTSIKGSMEEKNYVNDE
jgi:MoaA/NifB/PqqE/SkfB family radical SAM enzyme